MSRRIIAQWLLGSLCLCSQAEWARHTIDGTLEGADGVRLADVNRDGWQDIVTGWEESGQVRVYQNPGPKKARQPWPAVTVGKVASPEDAVFADLDQDGQMDVISSCEGRNRSVYVHWAPIESGDYRKASRWETEPIPALQGRAMWMFTTPGDINGDGRTDLVVGSKGKEATIGWLEAPTSPRKLVDWQWHPLQAIGWVMTIRVMDMDRDGDLDILFSDRKERASGIYALINPSNGQSMGFWKKILIGARGEEVMFMDVLSKEEKTWSIWAAIRSRQIQRFTFRTESFERTQESIWKFGDDFGTAKAVVAGDLDSDGKMDLVVSCENANDAKSGVFWLPRAETTKPRSISGSKGVKFDRMELIDLDGDGDLDILTCEERDLLGVLWYENPHIK